MAHHRPLVPAFLCLAVLATAAVAATPVRVWEEKLVIPTYLAGPPDPNPMFYLGRTYQGAKGAIYPYPLYDKLTDTREDRAYKAVYLENEYLKICVLPELGGRIFAAVDKTNGYDFFYHQHVIKPALIGMLGAWISGGVEWNLPHHHRASSFLPVQYRLEEGADGSRTVWVGEMELRHRLRWTIGLTLRPGRSYLEATVRLFNRTPVAHSLLSFANVAVHANPDYQIIFPPRTQFVTQHAKREFARWPVADSVYNGIDFRRGVDVSWWKNHPSSISMFAWNYEDDFLAGYDHGKRAGTLHVADHHIVPGKKFFTWGTGPSGRMWDRILADQDGPYLELMVGAYSDNQPDYSWIQPHEVKSFKQYWYPFREIGGVKNANLDAAVNLDVSGGQARVGFTVTAPHSNAVALLAAGNRVLLREPISIAPDKPFVRQVALPAGVKDEELRASLSAAGRELVSYAPVKVQRGPMPEPVRPPAPPSEIKSNEELYLTGLRLEQFHSPALEPDPYYEEALRRDPGDARANTALAILYLKRGRFAEAEQRLRAAMARLSRNYTAPKDGEPCYYLGVALQAQGKLEGAYDAFHQAVWSHAWEAAASYSLAEIACLRHDFAAALEFLERSLRLNASDTRALNLQATVLRHTGRGEESVRTVAEVERIDPLDTRALAERALAGGPKGALGTQQAAPLLSALKAFPEAGLETAVEYANAGFLEDATAVLLQMAKSPGRAARLPQFAAPLPASSGVPPMVYYYLGYFAEKQGRGEQAAGYYRQAAAAASDYCFPFQLEAGDALRAAIQANPGDARAHYYLGNLLYDLQPENAASEWEAARRLDGSLAVVHRNLAIACSRQEGALDKAIASLETAVRLNPTDAMYFYELDQFYEESGASIEKRLEMLERHDAAVLERDDALSRKIGLLVQAVKYDRAIDLLTNRHFHSWEGGARVNVQDPWVDAHLLRGQERAARKSFSGALADFQAALTFPQNLEAARSYRGGRAPEILYWVGTAFDALGQRQQAREAWKQSAAQLAGSEEHPRPTADSGAALLYYQARSLEKLGEAAKATAIFQQLLDAATAALKRGEAVDYFAKFGERQSRRARQAQAHYIAGLGYLGLNQPENARQAFARAVELNPYQLAARAALASLK